MELQAIDAVKHSLKTARSEKVKLLHELIFDHDASRENRKNIRAFTGFTFPVDSEAFNDKVKQATAKFTNLQLITIANLLSLDISGTSEEITHRILEALCDIAQFKNDVENNSGSDTEIEPSKDQQQPSLAAVAASVHNMTLSSEIPQHNTNATFPQLAQKTSVSFSDIEHLITPFTGDKAQDINQWFNKFEALALSFGLGELQKFIFAERAIKGIALLFVRSEMNITNYISLKNALVKEFAQKLSVASVHQLLAARQRKPDESVFEYYLKMKELAKAGNLDDASLIHYIISGLNDTPQNKGMLFGISKLSEFKEKLMIYDEICKASACVRPKTSHLPPETRRRPPVEDKSRNITCFNCLTPGHSSSKCVHKDRGPKCKICHVFGHVQKNCPERDANQQIPTRDTPYEGAETVHINTVGIDSQSTFECTVVTINDQKIMCAINPQQNFNVINKDAYKMLKLPPLTERNILLETPQRALIQPLGFVNADLELNNKKLNARLFLIDCARLQYPIILGSDFVKHEFEQNLNLSPPLKNKEAEKSSLINVRTNPVARIFHIEVENSPLPDPMTSSVINDQTVTCLIDSPPTNLDSIDTTPDQLNLKSVDYCVKSHEESSVQTPFFFISFADLFSCVIVLGITLFIAYTTNLPQVMPDSMPVTSSSYMKLQQFIVCASILYLRSSPHTPKKRRKKKRQKEICSSSKLGQSAERFM